MPGTLFTVLFLSCGHTITNNGSVSWKKGIAVYCTDAFYAAYVIVFDKGLKCYILEKCNILVVDYFLFSLGIYDYVNFINYHLGLYMVFTTARLYRIHCKLYNMPLLLYLNTAGETHTHHVVMTCWLMEASMKYISSRTMIALKHNLLRH